MPNKHVHRPVGTVLGGTAAFALADPEHRLLETLGGLIGGWLGSVMPDRIDPPISPRHRSVGHGVLSAGGSLVALFSNLPRLQEWLRSKARELEAARSPSTFGHFRLLAALCRSCAGLIAGFLTGYACHLIQDSRTPAKLPVFA